MFHVRTYWEWEAVCDECGYVARGSHQESGGSSKGVELLPSGWAYITPPHYGTDFAVTMKVEHLLCPHCSAAEAIRDKWVRAGRVEVDLLNEQLKGR